MRKQGHGIADVESVDNYLVDNSYFEAIGAYILTCMTPMTMAIQGDWGTGKTTAMKLIQQEIEKQAPKGIAQYPILEFNTWQYSKFSADGSLINSLMSQLAEKVHEFNTDKPVEKSASGRFDRFLKKKSPGEIATTIAANAVALYAEKIFGSIALDAKDAFLKEIIDIKTPEEQDSLEILKKKLEDEIAEIVKGGRLIIFVDDLDRLEPREAIELLEGLKVFLDLKNCVFVLAMDQQVVFQGIRSKYGEEFGDKKGKRFFDKIIQVPFNLPTKQYNITNYMKHLFEESQVEQNPSKQTLERYVNAVTCLGDCNPRSIKRSLNQLALYELILKENLNAIPDGKFYLFVFLVYQKIQEYKGEKNELLDMGSEKELEQLLEANPELQMALGILPEESESPEGFSCTSSEQLLQQKKTCKDFMSALGLLASISQQSDSTGVSTFEEVRKELTEQYGLTCQEAAEGNPSVTTYTYFRGNAKLLKISRIYADKSYNLVVYRQDGRILGALKSELASKYNFTSYKFSKSHAVFIKPTKQMLREIIIPRFVES